MSFGSSNKSGGQAARIWAADFAFKVRMWARAIIVSCLLYLLLLGYLVHKNTWPIWREVTWKFQVAKLFRDFPIQPYFIIGGRRYRASDMLRKKESYQMEAAVLACLNHLKWYPSPVVILVLGGAWLVVRRKNARVARREHIRGPVLIPERKLARQARKEGGFFPSVRSASPFGSRANTA